MKDVKKHDILKTHNDYETTNARTKYDEIVSDPFGIEDRRKGFALNHEKSLENYIDELVANRAKYIDGRFELSFDSLAEHHKNEIAHLYIEYSDRDLSECIYGDDVSINSEFTCTLLSMLKNDSKESREKFAETTRTNILKYYEREFQRLIDGACDVYLNNSMEEAGMYARQDRDTGDIYWGKI
jgi:hypothetical protein